MSDEVKKEELFAQIIEQVEDAQNRIQRELKLLSQKVTRMYDDGKIAYDDAVELSKRIADIWNIL